VFIAVNFIEDMITKSFKSEIREKIVINLRAKDYFIYSLALNLKMTLVPPICDSYGRASVTISFIF
jgi:hypothetical protein